DLSTCCFVAGEWTLVFGFEAKFNGDHPWSKNHFLHKMQVARERCGKWASKLAADVFLPFHEQAGNLQHHIVSVVRHDAIQVRAGPGVVILVNKRFGVKSRVDCRGSGHGYLLGLRHFTPRAQKSHLPSKPSVNVHSGIPRYGFWRYQRASPQPLVEDDPDD